MRLYFLEFGFGGLVACTGEQTGQIPTPQPNYDKDNDGYLSNQAPFDCDDSNPAIHPEQTEIWYDGVDQNCDGQNDFDQDGDGYLSSAQGRGADCVDSIEDFTSEELNRIASRYGTLNDNSELLRMASTIHPASEEVCEDGIDQNCDGLDSLWQYSYADSDGDGYGNVDEPILYCETPEGDVSLVPGDCDDENYHVNPGAIQTCADIDENCNGLTGSIDPTVPTELRTIWAMDLDQDGYGNALYTEHTCEQPVGYVDNTEDCDDSDASIYPGAAEYCNDLDDDCDFEIDEPDAVDALVWYEDSDADGFGVSSTSVVSCDESTGYALQDGDCDDSNNLIHPDAPEVLFNGTDDNCDSDYKNGEFTLPGTPQQVQGIHDESEFGTDLIAGSDLDGDGVEDFVASQLDGDSYLFDNTSQNWAGTPFTVQAATDFEGLGEVLYASDVDSDGYADLIFGNPSFEAGVVTLCAGPFTSKSFDASGCLELEGDHESSEFGASLGVYDFDADGSNEVIVGATEDQSVYLFSQDDLNGGEASASVTPTFGRTQAGAQVAAGDITGTGFGDLFVSDAASGSGQVFYFEDMNTDHVDYQDADVVFEGRSTGAGLGSSLLVTDLEGDGHDDFCLGSSTDNVSGNDSGAVYCYLSSATTFSSLAATVSVTSTANTILQGANAGDRFGTDLKVADLDGNGSVEVFASSPQHSPAGLAAAGSVTGFEVTSSWIGNYSALTADYRLKGSQNGDAVSSFAVGDFDNDGFDDLAVGATGRDSTSYSNVGAVQLVFGAAQ